MTFVNMALRLLYQIVLLAIVSCQTQNSTDQFEAQNVTSQYNLTSQIANDEINIITNETSIVPVTETATIGSLGIDEGDNGKADDLADYVSKKVGEFLGGGEDVKENERIDVSTPSETDLQNCSLPTILDRFCDGIPEDVHAYFKFDMSLPSILASIFKPYVVESLQSSCTPGNWCLSDIFHQDVIQSKNQFYLDSPFCSDAMSACVKKMQDERSSCGEKELNYLVNTIDLMCDLQDLSVVSQECYARTLETIYVIYADLTNSHGSQNSSLEQTNCNDYKVQLTKTYLCADDVCNFDQNLLLAGFESLVGVAQNAADVAMACNISRTCQSDYVSDVYDGTTSYGYYDDYNNNDDDNYDSDEYNNDGDAYVDVLKELEDAIQKENKQAVNEGKENDNEEENASYGSDQSGTESEINTESNEGYEDQDRSMMVGLIVITTAILIGFLGLVFIVYRRFKRSRNGNYKWGYSQLTNEDARVVHNDYK